MRRGSWAFGLMVASAVVIASAEPSSAAWPIPAAHDVDHIVLRERARQATITNHHVIEQFVAFLRARNTGWRKPLDTFPTPEWTIHLVGRRDLHLVLWLGPNWLGGREGQADARNNRLRSLSKTEHDEALKILGATRL